MNTDLRRDPWVLWVNKEFTNSSLCPTVPHFSATSRGPHPPASRGRKACGGPENASDDRVPPFHARNPSSFTRTTVGSAVDFNTDLPGRARACAQSRCERIMRGTRSGPAARRSNFYRSKVTYHGKPGFYHTHTLQCTLLSSPALSLYVRRFPRPPPAFPLSPPFVTRSSRS